MAEEKEQFGEEVIAAIATPPGTSGIGKIRISGEQALKVADKIFHSPAGIKLSEVESHTINYGFIKDLSGQEIDEVLALVMRSPRSFTGEDTVEFDCHGGMLPLQGVLEAALEAGARLAEPGEFSRRAFLNGRIDLAQAEGIIDLINAKSSKGREIALQQLRGRLSEHIGQLRSKLLDILTGVEASIDFPEDEIPELDQSSLGDQLEEIRSELEELIASSRTGRIYQEGIETVIAGKPNVGKSSLLNYLLNENRAIVTDIPGTTRDVITELISFAGLPLKIVDTAGIRRTEDRVEKIGVEKSQNSLKTADLVLLMLDVSQGITAEDLEIYQLVKDKPLIILVNKTDLPADLSQGQIEERFSAHSVIFISVREETGLQELKDKIYEIIMGGRAAGDYDYIITRLRHQQALEEARDSLGRAIEAHRDGVPADLLAVDLKEVLVKLGEITGDTVAEDVIERIFADFCIGK